MRKFIITTILLLSAAIALTVVYFKNLNTTAAHTTRVMQSIPNTAALIFEFSNDNGFYDIFNGNELLGDIAGHEKMEEFVALRQKLLLHPLLKNFFDGQHIYLSVHGLPRDTVDFLMTIAGNEKFNTNHIDELAKQSNTGLIINSMELGGKPGYKIYFTGLKKRFYLVNMGNHILSGSFSEEVALQSARYMPAKIASNFLPIPDQQNSNSLANLYVNYMQLTPLFDQFFITKNTPILKSLRTMPALSALTLNYKTDALMFNGLTNIIPDKPLSYLGLYRNQQPVAGHLKDIFPSTTALSASFALSDTKKFVADLTQLHISIGLLNEKNDLFNKIQAETGVKLLTDFNNLLTGEFAMLTTRYDEKFGIVAIKDGSQMRPLMVDISKMETDDIGEFKYNKVPFYLLGDAFGALNHPYFIILDNYLILANSVNELKSYKDSYLNHKFLNKTEGYAAFDNMLAERSNITFFVHFRNLFPILKRDMKPSFAALFDPDNGFANKYYALSWQFSAADNNFYSNFYMRLLKKDTPAINN
jgi:hypothetical protein